MGILLAEWLKTKRTPFRWLVFLAPVIFAALLIGYFSLGSLAANASLTAVQIFFETWAVLVIPMGIGLVSGLVVQQEELAGSFNGLLGSKPARYKTYFGKLAMLVFALATGTLIALFSLLAGLSIILKISISMEAFLGATIMVILGAIPILTFHLWIGLAWGMGATIGIGGAGVLAAALMATSLGDSVWQFVPWGWPVRLSMLSGSYLLLGSGADFSDFSIRQGTVGLVFAIIFFVVMLLGGLAWFSKWEGREA